ncbi:MAG: GntR family transcriptional regulator [Azospirillaceae bacterium]
MKDHDDYEEAPSGSTIVRLPLVPQIVSRLRDEIVAGQWEPGAKMPEAELSVRFGVSRTPLRQAFKVLESEGLLDLQPNRGAVVTRPTLEGIDDNLSIIAALEGLAIEAACAVGSEAEITAILAIHDEMMGHFENGDVAGYFRENNRIHKAIVKAGRNRVLTEIHTNLLNHVERARNVANTSRDLNARSMQEHEEIASLLRARNGKKARKVMERHTMSIRGAIHSWLDEERDRPVPKS